MKRYALVLAIVAFSSALVITACAPSAPSNAPVITTTPAAAPSISPTTGVNPTLPSVVVIPTGAATSAPTSAPTAAATTAPTQAATRAPATAATPSGANPTVAPNASPTPAAGAACRNNSTFVSDVDVPDGTLMAPGQQFVKTWRLRNTGTCTWDGGYKLVFERGTNMGTGTATIPATAPGATADVQLPMTAPTTAGSHIGHWRLQSPAGTAFGQNVWASIRVGTATTPAAAPTLGPTPSGAACTNNSTFVADVNVPDGTQMAAGQQFIKTWRIRNSGTCAWGDGYTLAFERGTAMTTTTAVALPATAPGAEVDVSVTLTAPTTNGTFTSRWRPKAPNGTFFGQAVWATVRVGTGPAAAPPLVPGAPGATLDDPGRAFIVGSAMPAIAPGKAEWVKFEYNNADNALPRPNVTITALNGISNGLVFEVYSPETLVPNWADNRPVGHGTPEVLTNCIEGGVNIGQCTTDNLTWVGGFGLSGTYYARIINVSNVPVTPRITISGPGLVR